MADTCDLCGMPLKREPVIREIGGETKHFCCNGCANAYEKAHANDLLDQLADKPSLNPGLGNLIRPHDHQNAYFSIDGMWCAGCAVAAEKLLRNQPGVQSVDVSFAAERGRIQYDPKQVDLTEVLQRLDGLGYHARSLTDFDEQRAERHQERTLLRLLVAAAFGMQIMLLYLEWLYPLYAQGQFNAGETRSLQYVVWALATPVLFIGGSSILRGAWRSLRARTATMDTLVALGTLSAYTYSAYIALTGSGEAYFNSVAMITMFIMLGRYLETVGGTRARKDIRHLLSLQPQTAHLQHDGGWQDVQAHKLVAGDTILVKPGERVPADAEVVEGYAAVDQALLTGESLPVEQGPGDLIFAGTIVTDNALTARVKRPVEQTRLSQITHLVEQTLATKPPVQRLADKASAYFAFGILAAAMLTIIAWLLIGHTVSTAILAGVAVLVVACPCALGLATPLALTVTLGHTTRKGILVRNAVALETAAQVQRIVFDKTGTLTCGQMTVVKVATAPDAKLSEGDLLGRAAAVEQFSEHPIAHAITAANAEPLPKSADFKVERGRGVSAQIDDTTFRIGSLQFVGGEAIPEWAQSDVDARTARSETVVWVGWAETIAGYIVLRDEPNPSAHEALAQLRAADIIPVLLSGDDPRTTQAIAQELEIPEFEGSCDPAGKGQQIRQWQHQGERVAMVGDGVNDAPALAQADLSITVMSGTDVAAETSDIVLMQSDLTLIPWFIRHSRRTRKIIYENLGWAFAYNLIAVPLAAFGVISPIIAAATMATSSLLVVGNSLRLRR